MVANHPPNLREFHQQIRLISDHPLNLLK